MPVAAPIIGAIATGISVGVSGITILGFTGFVAGIIAGVGSLALGVLQQALSPKPKLPSASTFGTRERTVQVRQPITAWRIVYGLVRVSGPIVRMESTSNNQFLHYCLVLACHEVDRIGTVQLNDYFIFDSMLNASGMVTTGRYANKVRIKKYLGAPGQVADPDLVSETSATASDIATNKAYIYVRLEYDRDLFPSAIPNLSAWVWGKKCFDMRDSGTRFTLNPVLFIADYLQRTRKLGGLGVASDGLDTTTGTAAANVCEEFVNVDTTTTTHSVTSASAADDTLTLNGTGLKFQLGDRVQITNGGTLPGGLSAATNYYVIPWQEASNDVQSVQVKLATTYANALARSAINITSAGSGTHTLTKHAEPRYAASGVVDLSSDPSQILDDMRSSMAGRLYPIGGSWHIKAGVYEAPTISIDDDDIRAPISISTRVSDRERFNAVKGLFVSPERFWQPTDYPVVTNAAYETVDNGVRIYTDIDFPFTPRPFTCQRLAAIELHRARQELTAKIPCNLSGFRLRGGDTVQVTNTKLGWVNRIMEVVELSFVVTEDKAGIPMFGVDLSVRDTASTIYDWSTTDEGLWDPGSLTTLPDVFSVAAPGVPDVTEELYDTRTSAGVKAKAVITWTASVDAFVVQYKPEFKLSADSTWMELPAVLGTTAEVLDIEPGTYDFRVKAISRYGISSSYATRTNVSIQGLSNVPADLQDVSLAVLGGLVVIRWTRVTELDVLIGGKIVWRHSPRTSGATWSESTTIGEAIPGSETVALLPLKTGTYLGRVYDSTETPSDNVVSVSTDGATVLQYANVSTVSEHTAFSGTHANTVKVDNTLRLDEDGFGAVLASGTYTFAAGVDLGVTKYVRLRAHVLALVYNISDFIDDRTELIDTWADIDNTSAASADAQVWVRTTNDNPNASPTWGAWNRLDSAEYFARGFQFQCRLSSEDTSYNIQVSELSVMVDSLLIDDHGLVPASLNQTSTLDGATIS